MLIQSHMTLSFLDKAGFKLIKVIRRGRNIIGHEAIWKVLGQCGGKSMCASFVQNGLLYWHANLGSDNMPHIQTFLDRLQKQNWFHEQPQFSV